MTTNRTFSERSLKSLTGIHPTLQLVVAKALLESPYDFVVIDGMRTIERQRELVRKGHSQTLDSRHLHGLAVDLWPVHPKTGKAVLGTDDKLLWELLTPIAETVKAAGRASNVTVEWGGDWKSFKDGPHFQLPKKDFPNGVKYNSLDPRTLLDNVHVVASPRVTVCPTCGKAA